MASLPAEDLRALLDDVIDETETQRPDTSAGATTSRISQAWSALEKFRGRDDPISFAVWIGKFEEWADFENWNDDRRKKALPLFMIGHARVLYRTLTGDEKLTYETMKAAFRARLTPAGQARTAMTGLDQRRQGPNESVADYADDIRRLTAVGYHNIKPATRDYISTQAFLSGLRPDLGPVLATATNLPFETVVEEAQRRENYHNSGRLMSTVCDGFFSPIYNDPLTRQPSAQWTPVTRGPRMLDDRPMCAQCGQRGHIRRFCPRINPGRKAKGNGVKHKFVRRKDAARTANLGGNGPYQKKRIPKRLRGGKRPKVSETRTTVATGDTKSLHETDITTGTDDDQSFHFGADFPTTATGQTESLFEVPADGGTMASVDDSSNSFETANVEVSDAFTEESAGLLDEDATATSDECPETSAVTSAGRKSPPEEHFGNGLWVNEVTPEGDQLTVEEVDNDDLLETWLNEDSVEEAGMEGDRPTPSPVSASDELEALMAIEWNHAALALEQHVRADAMNSPEDA